MKQYLRFRGGYCPKRIQPTYLLFTIFLLTGVGGKEAFGQASAQSTPPDTTKTIRDTLAIEEVEINAGYYTTTRKTSTGNIARVTAEDIANTPAFNPLASLAARVPGLVVSQTNGTPGSSIHVQLRGRNSITQGSEPLYIINGVPFATGGEVLNTMGMAAGSTSQPMYAPAQGLSPFNLINAEDILAIEVLKDADALAIYGSRGANGVILITTKSGQAGETRIDAGFQQGYGRANHRFRMLDTREYVAMRKEAFANDGLEPSADPRNPGYAPDLTLWDTTRYTDLQELLTGGTAGFTNAQLGVSGGTGQTRFRIGGAYKKESGVMPGGQSNNLASLNAQVSHASVDGRLRLSLTSTASRSGNRSTASDLSSYLHLPPNVPALHGADGKLVWEENGYGFDNPLAYLHHRYLGISESNNHNLTAGFALWRGLSAKVSVGYNAGRTDESAPIPQEAFDPAGNTRSSLRLVDGNASGWIAEPQLNYSLQLNGFDFDALIGATWQHSERSNRLMRGEGFADDLLLGAIGTAEDINVSNTFREYNYQAVFGRLAINYADRYVLNFTGRRDGSSRFGPGKQYANFGAVGAAWVISGEPFLAAVNLISFAKLRASYGITGNDQISDYQYLDAWEATQFASEGGTGIKPVRLFNPDYAWEINRKLEAALEIGLLEGRVFLTSAYFRNRSGNQLVNYKLPIQAGFSAILRNFDAIIQNRGWEFMLECTAIGYGSVKWDFRLNGTIQRNSLLEFPALASSNYANLFVIGQPLTVRQGYAYRGIDAQGGLYTFADLDGDGRVSGRGDYTVIGNAEPRFFGGVGTTVAVGGLSFNALFDCRFQNGPHYAAQFVNPPGQLRNYPVYVLDAWPAVTDPSVQRYTARTGTEAHTAFTDFKLSGGAITDAAFFRCQSASVSWAIPSSWLARFRIARASLSLQAQNLFTLSNYLGGDPETLQLFALPPLSTYYAGIQLQL